MSKADLDVIIEKLKVEKKEFQEMSDHMRGKFLQAQAENRELRLFVEQSKEVAYKAVQTEADMRECSVCKIHTLVEELAKPALDENVWAKLSHDILSHMPMRVGGSNSSSSRRPCKGCRKSHGG